MNEKLSALVDGELGAPELKSLLEAMRKDPELRKQYGRYVRIQSSINNENGPDVADQVWARLKDEPALLVPKASRGLHSRGVRRITAGLAVAATVAGLAVGSLNWLAPGNPETPTLVATSPEQADYVRVNGTHWQVDDPSLEDDLNVYLVEHGGYAGSSAMNGMQSYVKVAGYDK